MESDRKPTAEELTMRPLSQLRDERANLPTDDYFARVVDPELRDRYNEAIRDVQKDNDGVPAP